MSHHSFDSHCVALNSLCRICGNKNVTVKQSKKGVKPKSCSSIIDKLYFCGIDIRNDTSNHHSEFICQSCRKILTVCLLRTSMISRETLRSRFQSAEKIWCDFDPNKDTESCSVCSHRNNLSRGTIYKASNILTQTACSQTISHGQDNSLIPSTSSGITVSPGSSQIEFENNEDISYFELAFEPWPEVDNSIESNPFLPPSVSTPIKNQKSNPDSAVHRIQTNQQGISFDNDRCDLTEALKTPQKAITTTDCATSPIVYASTSSTSPLVKSFQSVNETVSKQESEPLTKIDEILLTSLAKRKLYDGPGKKMKNFLQCQTGGLPLSFHRVIISRKKQEKVSSKTMKKRAQFVSSFRKKINSDQSSEIKTLAKQRRIEVLKKVGINTQIQMSRKQGLFLKEILGLSTRKARVLNSRLRQLGVKVASEISQKNFAKETVKDFVSVEKKLFSSEDCLNEFEVPVGRVKNIPLFVNQLLDQYEAAKMITWHDEKIPKDEVWLKIGGDHGKNSLKLTMEVVNTIKPNSQGNTIVIGIASVKDTYENIKSFLNTGILDDLVQLKNQKWKDKNIRLFLNGDYLFITQVFGLSGPAAVYPCVWCDITKSELQHPLTTEYREFSERTLENLITSYEQFMKETHGDRKDAQKYRNCIHKPLFQFELTSIAPPYLHILLGLTYKHHTLLKADVHNLDIAIENQKDCHTTEKGKLIKKYGGAWQQVEQLKNQIHRLQHYNVFRDMVPQLERIKYERMIEKAENELLNVAPSHPINQKEQPGPILNSVKSVLHEQRIKEQPYYGGTFTGNHCHRYMKEMVYEKITNEVKRQTEIYTTDALIHAKAQLLKIRFDRLNTLFKKVHEAISHTKHIDTSSTLRIQKLIDDYIAYYKELFKVITPKHHILEKHCTPFIRRHGFGLGLLGEQGTEASHQTISKISSRSVGINNEVQKLKFIMTTHLLDSSPSLFSTTY